MPILSGRSYLPLAIQPNPKGRKDRVIFEKSEIFLKSASPLFTEGGDECPLRRGRTIVWLPLLWCTLAALHFSAGTQGSEPKAQSGGIKPPLFIILIAELMPDVICSGVGVK